MWRPLRIGARVARTSTTASGRSGMPCSPTVYHEALEWGQVRLAVRRARSVSGPACRWRPFETIGDMDVAVEPPRMGSRRVSQGLHRQAGPDCEAHTA